MTVTSRISEDSVVAALRAGFSNTQIASSFGVTDSAVTQFIESHNLQHIAAQNSKFQVIDDKLNDLEGVVLTKLANSMKLAILDPIKLAAVYKVLNGARRRSLSEGSTINNFNQVRLVSLNLPQHVQVSVGMNARNEVIEVDGRAINTMPAGKLVELAGVKTRGALTNDKSRISNIADII